MKLLLLINNTKNTASSPLLSSINIVKPVFVILYWVLSQFMLSEIFFKLVSYTPPSSVAGSMKMADSWGSTWTTPPGTRCWTSRWIRCSPSTEPWGPSRTSPTGPRTWSCTRWNQVSVRLPQLSADKRSSCRVTCRGKVCFFIPSLWDKSTVNNGCSAKTGDGGSWRCGTTVTKHD